MMAGMIRTAQPIPEFRVTVKVDVGGVEVERSFDLEWTQTVCRLIGHEGGLADKDDAYRDAFSNEVVGMFERWIKECARLEAEEFTSRGEL